ncbi:MAG: hypothetical protein ACI9R3_000201 [Verrucomicrobiales bacterium]|jgi:hypothetical protein
MIFQYPHVTDMSHNRLSTTETEIAFEPNAGATALQELPMNDGPEGFDHTDPDECELFRLATHIVQYDEPLTEILVKIALRKAELSEAG